MHTNYEDHEIDLRAHFCTRRVSHLGLLIWTKADDCFVLWNNETTYTYFVLIYFMNKDLDTSYSFFDNFK